MPTAKVTKAAAKPAEKPAEVLMGVLGGGSFRNHVIAIAPAGWTPEQVARLHGLWC